MADFIRMLAVRRRGPHERRDDRSDQRNERNRIYRDGIDCRRGSGRGHRNVERVERVE
jgi:hypothetical protein